MDKQNSDPWAADEVRNPHLSDEWLHYYTLRFHGLVRGQICGFHLAQRIAATLNQADVEGAI